MYRFFISQSTIRIAEENLKNNGFSNTGIKDRGFMDLFILEIL